MRSYRRGQPEPVHASLTPGQGGLEFRSSYDAGLVAEFKARIPFEGRRWDPVKKVWIVDARYGGVCAELAEAYLGLHVLVPQVQVVTTTETRLLKVEYLGRCKSNIGVEGLASGWVDGGWNAKFPEGVLRSWFEATPQRPDEKPTLYAVLSIKATAGANEIKSAYRRMARQWHPDVCHEADAAEVFKAINHAYQVLSNEVMRRKYDAGLRLEASLKTNKQAPYDSQRAGYRSPLRCGWVLAEGQETLGRFVVSKILQFEDIVDATGRVMVSSWPVGGETFEVSWV